MELESIILSEISPSEKDKCAFQETKQAKGEKKRGKPRNRLLNMENRQSPEGRWGDQE